jgi:hypothetical protein
MRGRLDRPDIWKALLHRLDSGIVRSIAESQSNPQDGSLPNPNPPLSWKAHFVKQAINAWSRVYKQTTSKILTLAPENSADIIIPCELEVQIPAGMEYTSTAYGRGRIIMQIEFAIIYGLEPNPYCKIAHVYEYGRLERIMDIAQAFSRLTSIKIYRHEICPASVSPQHWDAPWHGQHQWVIELRGLLWQPNAFGVMIFKSRVFWS